MLIQRNEDSKGDGRNSIFQFTAMEAFTLGNSAPRANGERDYGLRSESLACEALRRMVSVDM